MAEDQGFDPTQFGAVAVEEPPPFDPTQHGAIPVQEQPKQDGGVASGILAGLGRALNPINIVKGALDIGQPSDISNIYRYGKTLGEIVTGKSPDVAIGQNIPELQQQREAVYGKLGGKEQAAALTGIGLQLGLTALPFLHGETLPRAPGSLAEVAGIPKPEAAPEAAPISTAAAIETPKEVTPDAVQEQSAGSVLQHPQEGIAETGGQRVGVEPSVQGQEIAGAREVSPPPVGNEPVAQEPVAPTVPQPEQAAARPEPPEPATFSVESPTDVFGSEHTPVSSFLTENKVMSKSTARKNGMLEKNPDLWDDATNLSHPTHNKIYEQGGGLMPDIAAQMLHDAGLIPDADVGTMWQAVSDESKSARSTLKAEQGQVADIKQQAGQVKDFSEAQHDEWEKGKPVVQVKDLQVGDTVTVKGESMKVADIDPDTFDVTLEDGRKFGVQTVKDNTVIYGEHEAGPVARTPTVEPPAETPALEVPKTTEPTAPIAEQPETVPTPAETQAMSDGEDKVGIAERYREEEQPGSVIPGVGRTADEARDWGQKFINKGGNPYDVIANKGPKRELWQDVGVVRAEYERLSNEKRAAESAWEANPDDPELKIQFEHADAAQRQWSKDAQPVLTRAGDALRAASRSYPREINSFSDFTDIVNDHFKGEVELTPEKRAELQKAVKAIRKGNAEATEARAQVTNEAVKKAGGKTMSFDDLKASLTDKMTKLLENCPT